TDEIRNSKAYKEYYACATGEATPKPKASARKKKGDSASFTNPPTPTPTTTVVSAPRLSATAKGTDEGTGSRPGVPDVPSDDSEEELSWNSFDDEEGDEQTKGRDESEGESDDESDDDNDDDNDETVKASSESDKDDDDNDDEEEPAKNDDEDTESGKGGDEESSSMSSFVTSMLNPTSDVGVESIFTTASSPIVSLQTSTPIMTHSTIATITTSSEAPIPPTTIPSIILENLLTFNSAFRFDERLRIEESVNATLKAEVLTRSSHSSRTSYAIAADLSEMELKKILIEKMEG
nr:hypothetical protein [Tanacetum cinerariifolium]